MFLRLVLVGAMVTYLLVTVLSSDVAVSVATAALRQTARPVVKLRIVRGIV